MAKANSKSRAPDVLLANIAKYVGKRKVGRAPTYRLARYCLMDALSYAFEAFGSPDCAKFLGPLVPGTIVPLGARVPGTQFELDQVKAAFDIGCLIGWPRFNDTGSAGAHPSDNVGGILAVADSLSRNRLGLGKKSLTMRDVMTALIKAYEIQSTLSKDNELDHPEIGMDQTFLVKVATTAVATDLMGGATDDVITALSNAFIDGHSLNIYRTPAHAGSRRGWAAADATSRGVWMASMTMRGETGYPAALTARGWGFYDVFCNGQPFKAPRRFEAQAIEKVRFNDARPQKGGRTRELALVTEKFKRNLALRFPAWRQRRIVEMFDDQRSFEAMPVPEFMEMFVI